MYSAIFLKFGKKFLSQNFSYKKNVKKLKFPTNLIKSFKTGFFCRMVNRGELETFCRLVFGSTVLNSELSKRTRRTLFC